MDEVLLVLKAWTDCGACSGECPFLTETIPGGYSCRLFGPLEGPDPTRHDNCLAAEEEGS